MPKWREVVKFGPTPNHGRYYLNFRIGALPGGGQSFPMLIISIQHDSRALMESTIHTLMRERGVTDYTIGV